MGISSESMGSHFTRVLMKKTLPALEFHRLAVDYPICVTPGTVSYRKMGTILIS